MDGTLTKAMHNFTVIKKMLGLPPDKPILESISTLPHDKANKINDELNSIEYKIALQAKPQTGAFELLQELKNQNKKRGILTRNNVKNALLTLRKSDLACFFNTDFIIGREICKPKPSPEGVLKMLKLWKVSPLETVIVGDYLFDLAAGRKAGIGTVYLDVSGKFKWKNHADLCISCLKELTDLIKIK